MSLWSLPYFYLKFFHCCCGFSYMYCIFFFFYKVISRLEKNLFSSSVIAMEYSVIRWGLLVWRGVYVMAPQPFRRTISITSFSMNLSLWDTPWILGLDTCFTNLFQLQWNITKLLIHTRGKKRIIVCLFSVRLFLLLTSTHH